MTVVAGPPWRTVVGGGWPSEAGRRQAAAATNIARTLVAQIDHLAGRVAHRVVLNGVRTIKLAVTAQA